MTSDPWQEAFYAFERASRRRFEPLIPVPLTMAACERLVWDAFAWLGQADCAYTTARKSKGPMPPGWVASSLSDRLARLALVVRPVVPRTTMPPILRELPSER